MKVRFINSMPNRVATLVMALQPSDYLKKIGIDAEYIEDCNFDYNCDIVVFAKQCNIDIAKKCKDKGIKTIWFCDDGLFYKHSELIIKENEYIDALISTCNSYTDFLRSLGFKKQVIQTILHHHCNFKNEIAPFKDKIKNIGYIGVIDQLHHFDEINQFVNYKGMNMVIRDQKDIIYADIDVGLAFIDKNYSNTLGLSECLESSWKDRLSYRSNVKIVNHMSYGIPSITSKYSSYIEVDKIAPGCTIFCETLDDVKSAILNLQDNTNMRKEMRENCIMNRNIFHIENIIKEYKILFDTLL